MNDSQKETLVSWLNDAYALENALIESMEKQVEKLGDDHPEVAGRISEHLEITRGHAEKIESCLALLGADTSKGKEIMAKVSGTLQSMTLGMADDNLVKISINNYTSEHMEIASYNSLIAAAEAMGEMEIADMCREILQDEIAMAEWLDGQIPLLTANHLSTKLEE